MIISPKTRQQVAEEYGICVRTLARWIKIHKLPITSNRLLLPKDLILIYETFGYPMVVKN